VANLKTITADGIMVGRNAKVRGYWLKGDGTNISSVILYDNASAASGDVLGELLAPAAGPVQSVMLPCDCWIEAKLGVYADVTIAGGGSARVGLIFD
jgi:hypothetical protein